MLIRNSFIAVLILVALNGCAAALPVMVVGVAAGAAVAVTQVVNLARDQYPDIDFDKPAPVEVTYRAGYDEVWNRAIDCLMNEQEQIAVMEKTSGVIRTQKNNLNDVSWIGKGLGKSSFLYEYNIVIRSKGAHGVAVQLKIPFWEEKVFGAERQRNIPEGSSMLRHVFFRNMAKHLTQIEAKMPEAQDEGVRYAPASRPEAQLDYPTGGYPDARAVSAAGKPGSYRPASVREVQERLAAAGYDPGPVDGIAGRKTREAIRRFQGEYGLQQTGEIDEETWDLLTRF